jgi:hypothetical protein
MVWGAPCETSLWFDAALLYWIAWPPLVIVATIVAPVVHRWRR